MSTAYGKKIKVGNGSLNVYTEGNGTHTIVILSGAGVTSPVLEYRPLYQKLSDTYKIAVVEKSGYGMSESTGTERTVQNMVNESREALMGAGIKPPYILAPHSYSGFEAIYWANTFPDEVTAVLSIDMGVPETAFEMEKALPPNKRTAMLQRTKKLYTKIQKKGFLAKLLKNFTVNTSGMLSSDYLNKDEKKLYDELFYKNLTNEEIFEENIMMTANAKSTAATGHLKVPGFFYISNMKT
ncbi:MAG: alpha/beta hydrolase, partial [Ruminococcus sp.]|nr:alpha/beta hydrolase [Ruminococcus sp.]